MSTGELIQAAVLRVMSGELEVFDAEPNYCTRVTRQIVEHALNLAEGEFYNRYRTTTADDNPDPVANVWARDLMKSLREQGLRVAYDDDNRLIYRDLKAGDLLCSYKLGEPIGHIAVLLSGGVNALAFENTGQQRGERVSNFNRLTRVDTLTLLYPGSWEAFRLPDAPTVETTTFTDGTAVTSEPDAQ